MVKKHIDMFTSEQYDILGDMIGAQKVAGNSRAGAIRWVWFRWGPKSSIFPLSSYRSRLKFLRLPLSDMPLYINDPEHYRQVIAIWRLKIGR